MQNGKLIIISGPSGSGKTTLYNEVKKTVGGIKRVVTTTTRPPREQERDGIDYYFVSPERFEQMVSEGAFLEHAIYSNNRYGTTKREVFDAIAKGQNVMIILDVVGATNIKKIYPEAILVFLRTKEVGDLAERLRLRGTDDESEIQRRLDRARLELQHEKYYDYTLVNDTLKEAVQAFKVDILDKEFHKKNLPL